MEPLSLNAEFGLSVMRFKYEEFKDAGSTWDKELGGITGLSFRLAQRLSAWEWEGRASYHYGRVDYTGQTNLAVPYYTGTDEEIGDFALRLGRWFDGSYPVMPYAGLGYRRWNRDIRPASLGGLFESYCWKYAWLGAKIMSSQQDTSHFMLDIGWIKPIGQVLYVGAYNANLTPVSRNGLRLMLASRVDLSENTMLTLEPYFEYWQFGRSPSVFSGGATVYEPASEARNIGINLRLGKMF